MHAFKSGTISKAISIAGIALTGFVTQSLPLQAQTQPASAAKSSIVRHVTQGLGKMVAENLFECAEKVASFMNEMRAVRADWQLVHYGNAVHSFTNPQAKDLQAGFCFDAKADARSWRHMREFFVELFS